MRVKGISAPALRMIADDTGVRVDIGNKNGHYQNFVLRLDRSQKNPDGSQKYGRINPDRRTVTGQPWSIGKVCYHGHFAFMRLMFEFEPDAILVSGLARYEGRTDFRVIAPEVAMGRPPHTMESYVPGVHGPAFCDTCTCPENVRDEMGGA